MPWKNRTVNNGHVTQHSKKAPKLQLRRGFTIVELLITVVIIAILATIIIVAYNGMQKRAQVSTISTALNQAGKKADLYYITNSTYPAALSDIGFTNTDIDYQYTGTTTTYCITGTIDTTSLHISDTQKSPTQGFCPGHTAGGTLATAYVAHAESDADAISYTFPGLSLGAVSANRTIAVALSWRAGGVTASITGITINGVNATIHQNHLNDTGGNRSAVTWASANVPTGATGDITVSFSAAAVRIGVTAWTLTGATPSFASSAAVLTNGGTLAPSGSANGVILSSSYNNTLTSPVATWTGATPSHASAMEGGRVHAAASASGNPSVSVNWSQWDTLSIASAAAFSP